MIFYIEHKCNGILIATSMNYLKTREEAEAYAEKAAKGVAEATGLDDLKTAVYSDEDKLPPWAAALRQEEK